MNLYVLIKYFLGDLPSGNVIEFGSYKGGSALFMGSAINVFLPGGRLYALDTYTGMPDVDKDIDAHSIGDFADVDLGELSDLRPHQK